MPVRSIGAVLGLGLSLLAATAAADGTSAETSHFDISLAGIRAGELTLTAERNGTSYQAGSRIRATGLVGAVVRIRYDGQVSGRIDGNGRVIPEVYTANSRSTRSERDTTIVFENGVPTEVRVEPPRATQVDPAEQAGTIDPLSAAYGLLLDTSAESACNSRIDLFDGSRRSQLVVGRPEQQDEGLVCNGVYVRVAGEAHSMSDEAEWPFRLVFRTNGDGSVDLERIETRTRFGLAVVSRRS